MNNFSNIAFININEDKQNYNKLLGSYDTIIREKNFDYLFITTQNSATGSTHFSHILDLLINQKYVQIAKDEIEKTFLTTTNFLKLRIYKRNDIITNINTKKNTTIPIKHYETPTQDIKYQLLDYTIPDKFSKKFLIINLHISAKDKLEEALNLLIDEAEILKKYKDEKYELIINIYFKYESNINHINSLSKKYETSINNTNNNLKEFLSPENNIIISPNLINKNNNNNNNILNEFLSPENNRILSPNSIVLFLFQKDDYYKKIRTNQIKIIDKNLPSLIIIYETTLNCDYPNIKNKIKCVEKHYFTKRRHTNEKELFGMFPILRLIDAYKKEKTNEEKKDKYVVRFLKKPIIYNPSLNKTESNKSNDESIKLELCHSYFLSDFLYNLESNKYKILSEENDTTISVKPWVFNESFIDIFSEMNKELELEKEIENIKNNYKKLKNFKTFKPDELKNLTEENINYYKIKRTKPFNFQKKLEDLTNTNINIYENKDLHWYIKHLKFMYEKLSSKLNNIKNEKNEKMKILQIKNKIKKKLDKNISNLTKSNLENEIKNIQSNFLEIKRIYKNIYKIPNNLNKLENKNIKEITIDTDIKQYLYYLKKLNDRLKSLQQNDLKSLPQNHLKNLPQNKPTKKGIIGRFLGEGIKPTLRKWGIINPKPQQGGTGIELVAIGFVLTLVVILINRIIAFFYNIITAYQSYILEKCMNKNKNNNIIIKDLVLSHKSNLLAIFLMIILEAFITPFTGFIPPSVSIFILQTLIYIVVSSKNNIKTSTFGICRQIQKIIYKIFNFENIMDEKPKSVIKYMKVSESFKNKIGDIKQAGDCFFRHYSKTVLSKFVDVKQNIKNSLNEIEKINIELSYSIITDQSIVQQIIESLELQQKFIIPDDCYGLIYISTNIITNEMHIVALGYCHKRFVRDVYIKSENKSNQTIIFDFENFETNVKDKLHINIKDKDNELIMNFSVFTVSYINHFFGFDTKLKNNKD